MRAKIAEIRELSAVAREAHAGDLRENEMRILKMRSDYNRRLDELNDLIDKIPKFSPGTELGDEYRSRYTETRRRIAQQQIRWGVGKMHENPSEFRRTSRATGIANQEFLSWIEGHLGL